MDCVECIVASSAFYRMEKRSRAVLLRRTSYYRFFCSFTVITAAYLCFCELERVSQVCSFRTGQIALMTKSPLQLVDLGVRESCSAPLLLAFQLFPLWRLWKILKNTKIPRKLVEHRFFIIILSLFFKTKCCVKCGNRRPNAPHCTMIARSPFLRFQNRFRIIPDNQPKRAKSSIRIYWNRSRNQRFGHVLRKPYRIMS